MKEYRLTTMDNPFNPITQFDEWYRYDEDMGYCTMEVLMRIAMTSDELSDNQNIREINRAVDVLMRLNPYGNYRKVDAEGNVYGAQWAQYDDGGGGEVDEE